MIRSISTLQQTNSLRDLISQQKKAVDKASVELATGLKQDVFSGRGSAPSQSLEFRARMNANESYLVANGILATRLDMTVNTLDDIRESASEFNALLVSGDISAGNRGALKDAARQALTSIVDKLNMTYAGEHIFSGTATDTRPVILNADNTVTYAGSGQDVANRVDDDTVLPHGIRADHPAIMEIMTTLSTIVNTDMEVMSRTDFEAFRKASAFSIARSGEEVTALQAGLGDHQGRLEKLMTRQQDLSRIYTDAILGIEGVEPEEAAVRLESLSNQIKSTFEVTARMSQLSFLNFMR